MLTASLQQAAPAVVTSQADVLWGCMLRTLDARQRLSSPPVAILPADSVPGIEAGALDALVTLVLKLSEAQFKPLFLRMLDWAASPPAATPGVGSAKNAKMTEVHAMQAGKQARRLRIPQDGIRKSGSVFSVRCTEGLLHCYLRSGFQFVHYQQTGSNLCHSTLLPTRSSSPSVQHQFVDGSGSCCRCR